MTPTSRTSEVWRWILAPCASVVAFVGTACFYLFLEAGPFPKDLVEPTASFLMGSLIVLAGSFFAPHHKVVTAIVLFFLGTLSSVLLPNLHIFYASTGGLVAIAFVVWWFHPRRSTRSISWVAAGTSTAFFAFIVLVYARFVDRPAHPEHLPLELNQVLGTNASGVHAFYRYDLGGFIDHQWLWRIDAKPDLVALVIAGLGLQNTNSVSRRFWRMAPHYWPRSMPTNAEAFQSPAFVADSRGPDGEHYFLLHDKAQERAFVWHKSNF